VGTVDAPDAGASLAGAVVGCAPPPAQAATSTTLANRPVASLEIFACFIKLILLGGTMGALQ